MYDFDGEFRSKPQQNLAGASTKLSREALIQKNQEERRKREQHRRETKAATTIQASVRTFIVRKQVGSKLREEFDRETQKSFSNFASSQEFDGQSIQLLLRNLLLFYQESVDANRLTQLGSHVIRLNEPFLRNLSNQVRNRRDAEQWLWRISRFLYLHVRHLHASLQSDSAFNVSIPLRLVQILTGPKTCEALQHVIEPRSALQQIWCHLLSRSYFGYMRKLFQVKVPEPFEETTRSTPAAHSIFELALRPLQLENPSPEYARLVCIQFFSSFLAAPLTPQIQHFFIPLLMQEMPPILKAEQLLQSVSATPIRSSGGDVSVNDGITERDAFSITRTCLPCNVWTLYAFVRLMTPQLPPLSLDLKYRHLTILRDLVVSLPKQVWHEEMADSDDEEQRQSMMNTTAGQNEADCREACRVGQETLALINSSQHVLALMQLCKPPAQCTDELLYCFSVICYSMLLTHDLEVHKYRLLYTLAFNSNFVRRLWTYVNSVRSTSVCDAGVPLIQLISLGTLIAPTDWKNILPQLTLFCALFDYLLPTNDDIEFYEAKSIDQCKFSTMPFVLDELRTMVITLRDLCLGLIELAYRDTKPLTDDYRTAISKISDYSSKSGYADDCQQSSSQQWIALFKMSIKLLRQLHNRDSRKQFCSNTHWISKKIAIPVNKPVNFKISDQQKQRYQPFVGLKKLSKQELELLGPPMSITEIRNITILQEIPFVIPFTDRVQILQLLITKDKEEHHGNAHHFMLPNSTIDILIRRNYLYEDAFEKLSFENEPDLKKHIRVQMVNEIGLDEAGIDGGGIFREFLSQLLKTAFDPNRGFFRATNDNFLYPNSCADVLHENYQKHYFFIGRILGKAIYENMLTELPFSLFFLAKMLDKHQQSNIDIHHLATLDPLMYKNLVYLKNYEGDVSQLDLDFTAVNNDFGKNSTIELKPNGSNIPVTSANRIEYIHLVADYRLNKQIRPHCTAFKKGLANVIDLDWLRMFSPRELRILICGAQVPIDLNDLRSNCIYSGGYQVDHPTIRAFWEAISTFDETHKRKLLKFVTSCSRPPLLGFKHLEPPFTIQYAGREDRLPTASTCMNLLKLPEFSDVEQIRQKLIYAIEAEVGFELS